MRVVAKRVQSLVLLKVSSGERRSCQAPCTSAPQPVTWSPPSISCAVSLYISTPDTIVVGYSLSISLHFYPRHYNSGILSTTLLCNFLPLSTFLPSHYNSGTLCLLHYCHSHPLSTFLPETLYSSVMLSVSTIY